MLAVWHYASILCYHSYIWHCMMASFRQYSIHFLLLQILGWGSPHICPDAFTLIKPCIHAIHRSEQIQPYLFTHQKQTSIRALS